MKKLICIVLSCIFVIALTSQVYAIQNEVQNFEFTQPASSTVSNDSEEVIIHNVLVNSRPIYKGYAFLRANVIIKNGIITDVKLNLEIPRTQYGSMLTTAMKDFKISEDGKSFTAYFMGHRTVYSADGVEIMLEPIYITGTVKVLE